MLDWNWDFFWGDFLLLGLIGLLITLIFGPILLMVGFATEVIFIPGEWCFKRRMSLLGRYISRQKLRCHAAEASGTIIVDHPSFGWALSRVWWTSEDVVSQANASKLSADEPLPEFNDFKCRDFDAWVWDRYLNPQTGRALLIEVWHGRRKVESILHHCAHLKLIESFSMGKSLEEWGQKTRDPNNNDHRIER